jgi:hypothetical protein
MERTVSQVDIWRAANAKTRTWGGEILMLIGATQHTFARRGLKPRTASDRLLLKPDPAQLQDTRAMLITFYTLCHRLHIVRFVQFGKGYHYCVLRKLRVSVR